MRNNLQRYFAKLWNTFTPTEKLSFWGNLSADQQQALFNAITKKQALALLALQEEASKDPYIR